MNTADSAALDRQAQPQGYQDGAHRPLQRAARRAADPTAGDATDRRAVTHQPADDHDLEGDQHHQEPAGGVAGLDELREDGDEDDPGLRAEQVAERALAEGLTATDAA